MPLVNENRILVKIGLDRINKRSRSGLREILLKAGFSSDVEKTIPSTCYKISVKEYKKEIKREL